MRNMSNKSWIAAFFFLLAAWMHPAKAFLGVGDVVTDPGLTGQVIAAEVSRAGQAVTMIQNQINQYQTMLQNTLALGDPVFKPLGDTLRTLQNVYVQGQSLMWRAQNVDSQFGIMYPNYQSYLGTMGRGSSYFSDKYRAWSDRNQQSIRTALTATGSQVDGMESEQAMLQRLVLQSNTAGGQMQALQAANQIAANQAEQIMNLRLLIAEQNRLQANFMAQQIEERAADNANRASFRASKPTNSPDGGF